MTFDFVSTLIGFALGTSIGALGLYAVLSPKLVNLKEDQTKDLKDILRESVDQLLMLNREQQKQAQMQSVHDLEKRQLAIANIVEPIGKSLKDMDSKIENLGKAGAGLEAQLKNFADDQRNLREQTQKLTQALKNPVIRGQWGEMQLQRALEFVGMSQGVHYKTQVNATGEDGTQRPDFVVYLPNGVEIVIDVKTPLDPYWALMEETSTDAQEKNLTTFRQSVKSHIKALSAKSYSKQFNSPEFVVMFLPSESLYSTAIGSDATLLEEASKNNIILASPTTVMGLLRVIMYGWQQKSMAEEAKTISGLASDLYGRISIFGEHIAKLGKNLGTTLNTYNDAVGSMERSLLPTMKKLKDLHVSTLNKEIPQPGLIESMPRPITAQALLNEDAEIIKLKSSNQ